MSSHDADAAARAKRWGDLSKRALSAAVLGPAAVACIWLGAEAFAGMLALAAALLAWEWVHLCGRRIRMLPGMAVPLAVFAAGALAVQDRASLALPVLALGFLIAWYFANRMAETLTQPALRLALGVVYIGLAGIALIELRHDNEAGRANVLFLFAVVWASDIGAYMAGRLFGGPKLWPAVSPNKTWSGALGGVAAAILVGFGVARGFAPAAALPVAAVAILLAVASQAGDLLESAIKRHFRVKDSSHLIPGHGGVLDRLDGVLAAAPVAALLSLALGQGRVLWGGG